MIAAYYSLIQMLYNQQQKTWHPIVYVESPFPGPIDESPMLRLKSKMHHTAGLPTREAALESVKDLEKRIMEHTDWGRLKIDVAEDIIWTGEGMPVDIVMLPMPASVEEWTSGN